MHLLVFYLSQHSGVWSVRLYNKNTIFRTGFELYFAILFAHEHILVLNMKCFKLARYTKSSKFLKLSAVVHLGSERNTDVLFNDAVTC
jgi:hypothetical protein